MFDLLTLEFGWLVSFVVATFCTPYFILFFSVVCLLEWLKPAEVRNGFFPKAILYDSAIGMFAIAFQFLISNVILLALFSLYGLILPRLLAASFGWASLAQVVAALVIGDLLNWLSHFLRHKIRPLWRFHSLHHSQRQMNVFTEFRTHPFDILINSILQSLLLYLLYVPFEMSVAATVLLNYYLMFVHANVDLSYGWADRLFVSPAYHRTHHAIDPNLHDRNFGAVLSIWDTIFGTGVFERSDKIETGVDDFPNEADKSGWRVSLSYFRQPTFSFARRTKLTKDA
jgi:sterol desaturase/sphingolipid hydroxylase (fatty acid hydroxylase superfamily)